MVAPRARVFRPLVKGNEALGTRLAGHLLKEHNHVFAHAQDFEFWTGCREFKDAGMMV